MAKETLNDKQLKFCTEYSKHGNAMKAYRVAYPDASEATVDTNAARLLGNARVKLKVDEMRATTVQSAKVTREKVAEELASMGFTDIDVTNLKFSDKLKALELLSKMLGFLDGDNGDKSNKGAVEKRLFGALERVAERLSKRGSQP